LEKLRNHFGETINLGVLDGGRVVYLEVMESPKAMRLSARRGDHDFIHSSALGKAIAAELHEAAIARILEIEGLPRLTSRTITDPDAYLNALAAVRERGYATDFGEAEEGASCVAVSIPFERVAVRAAISLSAPATRFPDEGAVADLVDRLHEAAGEIGASFQPGRAITAP
jgi:IclR family acetate operon transcriptional repressor